MGEYPVLKIVIDEYVGGMIKSGNMLWKDLYPYLSRNCRHVPPVKINEIMKYHNLNDLMNGVYSHADFINWNRADISYG